MIALSGVRNSWLMLETNCDLCSLARCELTALFLDLVEHPHVLDRDRGLVGEGRTELDLLVGEAAATCKRVDVSRQIGLPSRNIGTPSEVR